SGSEEVGSYGIQAFIKENKSALKNFWGINIDNVGGKGVGVCYTSSEGMIFRVNPSPELIRLADQVKADLNEIEIYSLPFNMLHTDGTCMMLNGIPTISIVGLTPGGEIPDWHRQSDIFNNIDPVTVNNNELFVSELLHRINSEVESLGTD
ncbi:MAG: M28 family peptidase, partial [Anaerolineales bacterium]